MITTTALRSCVWRALTVVVAVTFLMAGAGVSYLLAQEVVNVVGVEEHWELVVTEPHADLNAPQITAVISPTGDVNGLHAAFELNHRTQPSFAGGGMQLQIWNGGESPLATKKQHDGVSLTNGNETITWTTKMDLENGHITFDIDDGASASWGAFGNGVIHTVATSLTDLNAYNPLVSVNGSGPGFAGNRVASLKVTKVVLKLSNGQVVEDTAEKVAYPVE
jgi:hypothetical protein